MGSRHGPHQLSRPFIKGTGLDLSHAAARVSGSLCRRRPPVRRARLMHWSEFVILLGGAVALTLICLL